MSQKIAKAANLIRARAGGLAPKTALILGSGLGAVADLLEERASISYADIPGFPLPTVQGHEGSLRIGTVAGLPLLILKGRVHFYEGPAEAAPALKRLIRTLKTVGVETLILTNAAGSLRPEYPAGSLVVIRDHINLTGTNPLAGPNDDEWGPRFPPMDNAWDADLRMRLLAIGRMEKITPLADGVYAQVLGPTFETSAEIRMIRTLGADTVAMSTAVENIVRAPLRVKVHRHLRHHQSRRRGMSDQKLSHAQTLEGAKLAEGNMAKLLRAFFTDLAKD